MIEAKVNPKVTIIFFFYFLLRKFKNLSKRIINARESRINLSKEYNFYKMIKQ